MKATYNGITYELETENDVKLFKQMSETKTENIIIEEKIEERTPTGRLPYKMVECVINNKHRKNKSWSEQEIKVLLANKDKSKRQLSKMLGRSKDSIKSRLWILKNEKSIPISNSNLNDYQNKVLTYYKNGTRPGDIAKLLNIKEGKLYRTLRMLKKTGLIKSGKNRLYATSYKKRLYNRYNPVFEKLEKLILEGKTIKELMIETGLTDRQIGDKKYRMKKEGKLNKSKEKITLDTATFDYISIDNMPVVRGFIKACIQSKRKFSLRDCEIYLGLNLGEARAFMLDVWQQQEKLGYKVKLEDNCLNFEV